MTHADQDDRRFDELVDGDLSPAEYRSLVGSLDDEPGGWRACALAFLEAQALRGEFSALRDERTSTATVVAKLSSTSPNRRTSRWLLSLAMAASFLLAVALGFALRSYWITSPASAGGSQWADGSESPVAPPDGDGRPDQALSGVEDSPSPAPANDPHEAQADQPMGNVTLIVDDEGNDPQRVEVPIYSLDQVGSEFLASDHTALSPEVADWLRRSGHQVQRVQSYFPMQLDDGQQVVVPVEEIQITPASYPPF